MDASILLKIGAGKEHFMKHIRLMIVAAVCGVALMFIAKANAQDVKQGVVTIVRIHGNANFSTDNGVTWQALKIGAALQPGAVIKTDPDSTVDVILAENRAPVIPSGVVGQNNAGAYAAGLPPTAGQYHAAVQQNVVRILGGTELAIDKLTYSNTGAETVSDTELDLRSGKVFGNVKKISAMSKYEIKTPTGVAGIRGTSFSMGSDGSVIVYDGSVVVSFPGANGVIETQVVNAGEQFTPGQVGPPVSVVPPGQSVEDWAKENKPSDAETEATTTGTETVTPTATPYVSP
jgi:hypothetical protein